MIFRMKKIFRYIGAAFFVFVFAGCNLMDSNFEIENESGIYNQTEFTDKAVIQINLDNNARFALPSLSPSDFTRFDFFAVNQDDSEQNKSLTFDSYDKLKQARIELAEGKYVLSLDAFYDNLLYKAVKTVDVKAGNSKLSFVLNYAGVSGYASGEGTFDITISSPDFKNRCKVVKAGLYTLSGLNVPSYPDEVVASSSSIVDLIEYKKEKVPAGSYVVKFKFYSDNECNLLIGSYQEYVLVSKDKISESKINYSDFSYCFDIHYDYGSYGKFKDEDKPPVSYTRYSGNLPVPALEGISEKYEFIGWYTDEKFNSSPVTYIDCSTGKDITLYAKFRISKTVTFDGNGRKFKENGTEKDSVTSLVKTVDGKTYILPSASSLGLNSKGPAFFGWARTKDALTAQYSDCEQTEFEDDNFILYAIYSKALINPTGESDPSDTDGDGLTDWKEIYEYHTDPNSKDTDGDGWSDKYEIDMMVSATNKFNPLIADLPALAIEIAGNPVIFRNYTVSTSTGVSETQTKQETSGETFTNSSTNSSTKSETHGWKTGISAGTTNGKLYLVANAEYNGNCSSSATVSYTNTAAQNWSSSISNGKTYTETETQTNNGGSITIPVKIKNNGHIAYEIKNLKISVYALKSSGDDEYVNIGELPAITNVRMDVTSSQSVSPTLTLNNEMLELLLKNTKGIQLVASGFSYSTQIEGKSVDFTEANTVSNAKCADLTVSFGLKNPLLPTREYKISTKTTYNVNASAEAEVYPPVSLTKFLGYAGITKTAEPEFKLVTDTSGHRIKSIAGVESQESSVNGDWYITIYHTDVNGTVTSRYYTSHADVHDVKGVVNTNYNIDEIMIYPQDRVHVFYDVDSDNDGVSYSEEMFYGTDDANTDSDGDGMSDFEEIYGFKRNGNLYRTDPMNKDTDYDAKEHPSDPQDNWNDYNDSDPVSATLSNIAEIESLEYSVTGKNDYESLTSSGNIYAVSKTASEYLYLKIKPKFKQSKVYIKDMNALGLSCGEYREVSAGTALKIQLAPLKENNILIKVDTFDGKNSTEYTVKCNSDVNSFPDVSGISASWKELKLTFDQYYDSRFDLSATGGSVIKNVKLSGYLIALTSANKDPGTLTKDIIYNAGDISGVTPKLSENESFDYFRLAGNCFKNSTTNIYNFNVNDKRQQTYYSLYAYEITDDNSVVFKKIKNGTVVMARPEYGRLTLSFDSLKAVSDKDNGYEPEYKGEWSSSGICFDNNGVISNVNFKQKISTKGSRNHKYYSFGSDSRSNNRPDNYSGKKLTKKFKISDLKKNGCSFSIWVKCKELDWGSDDDNLGTYYKYFGYNPNANLWSETNTGKVYKGAEQGCAEDVVQVRDGDGDFDINYTVNWEYIWE